MPSLVERPVAELPSVGQGYVAVYPPRAGQRPGDVRDAHAVGEGAAHTAQSTDTGTRQGAVPSSHLGIDPLLDHLGVVHAAGDGAFPDVGSRRTETPRQGTGTQPGSAAQCHTAHTAADHGGRGLETHAGEIGRLRGVLAQDVPEATVFPRLVQLALGALPVGRHGGLLTLDVFVQARRGDELLIGERRCRDIEEPNAPARGLGPADLEVVLEVLAVGLVLDVVRQRQAELPGGVDRGLAQRLGVHVHHIEVGLVPKDVRVLLAKLGGGRHRGYSRSGKRSEILASMASACFWPSTDSAS